MAGRMGWGAVALIAGALVVGGCGSSGGESSSPSTTTSSTAATASLEGAIYELTGTQTCKSAQGPGTVDLAIFPGSYLRFADDTATVNLRNEALEARLTMDGRKFRVHEDFDLSGTPVSTSAGGPASSTVLPLDLTGAVAAAGRAISGTGSDAGVNCRYDFTGRRVGSVPTTAPSTTAPTVPPTSAPAASPPTTVSAAPAAPQACDRAAALAKTIEIHPDTLLRSIDAVHACAGGYAVVSWGNGDFDSNTTLVLNAGRWVEATPADNVCGTPGVPPDVHLYACEVG
jgi:hypothetical protein